MSVSYDEQSPSIGIESVSQSISPGKNEIATFSKVPSFKGEQLIDEDESPQFQNSKKQKNKQVSESEYSEEQDEQEDEEEEEEEKEKDQEDEEEEDDQEPKNKVYKEKHEKEDQEEDEEEKEEEKEHEQMLQISFAKYQSNNSSMISPQKLHGLKENTFDLSRSIQQSDISQEDEQNTSRLLQSYMPTSILKSSRNNIDKNIDLSPIMQSKVSRLSQQVQIKPSFRTLIKTNQDKRIIEYKQPRTTCIQYEL